MMEQNRKVSINLVNKYAPWSNLAIGACSLWVRGYAFVDDKYYSEMDLAKYLANCLSNTSIKSHVSALKNIIPRLNGCWALVYESDSVVLGAVDRIRSIPLFYAMDNGKAILSDDAREIVKRQNNPELDDICAAELLVTSYVTGKDTLYKGLYQVQPGEILEITTLHDTRVEMTTHRYYRYIFGDYFEADERELEEELSRLLHRIFSRYATALKGKTPVIPVSGGWDSRLLVAMLKRCGVENAICFSYGKHGNAESEASRAVAKVLGYKWLFCPYDETSWYKWFREEQMGKYMDYASNCSTIAHLQDWPAIREVLHDTSADEAVFMPGLCLDMLTDIHLVPDQLLLSKSDAAYDILLPEAVLSDHYYLWPWYRSSPELKGLFLERITKLLPAFSNEDRSATISSYETWFFEARPCKFVINSVRAYEFFDCQWMLPWWDYELMDFFLRIKADLRIGRRLCRNTLLNRIYIDGLSELAEIPFVGTPLVKSAIRKAKYRALHSARQGLKKILPDSIKDSLIYRRGGHPLGVHGVYLGAQMDKRLESIISTIDLPPIANQILRPNARKKVVICPINGLLSMSSIARIQNAHNRGM